MLITNNNPGACYYLMAGKQLHKILKMNWKITYILFFTSLILFAGSCSKEEEEITDDLKYSLLFYQPG
jgi:hypothetical protein